MLCGVNPIACTIYDERNSRKRRESACGTPAVETTRGAKPQPWREHQSPCFTIFTRTVPFKDL